MDELEKIRRRTRHQLIAMCGSTARGLVLLALACPAASIDAVHKHMEPPPPYPTKPYVRHPLGVTAVRGTGLLAAAGRLVNRKSMLALVPVAVGAAIVTQPSMMERLLVHLICFIGSLFEPYDSVLDKKSPLKFFIKAVQKAKRDYDVKHGLVRRPPLKATLQCPSVTRQSTDNLRDMHFFAHDFLHSAQVSIDDQTFFDSEDEPIEEGTDDTVDEEASAASADDGAEGEQEGEDAEEEPVS